MTKKKLDLLKKALKILLNIPHNYKVLAQMKCLYNHIATNSLWELHIHSLIKNNDQVRTVFSKHKQ